MATVRVRFRVMALGKQVKGVNPLTGQEVIGVTLSHNFVDEEEAEKLLTALEVGQIYYVDWTPADEVEEGLPGPHLDKGGRDA